MIPKRFRNLFIPETKLCGALALHLTPGTPSYTMTLNKCEVLQVSQVRRHNEVVFDNKGGLLTVDNVALDDSCTDDSLF